MGPENGSHLCSEMFKASRMAPVEVKPNGSQQYQLEPTTVFIQRLEPSLEVEVNFTHGVEKLLKIFAITPSLRDVVHGNGSGPSFEHVFRSFYEPVKFYRAPASITISSSYPAIKGIVRAYGAEIDPFVVGEDFLNNEQLIKSATSQIRTRFVMGFGAG